MLPRKAQRSVQTALLGSFKASREAISASSARQENTAFHLGLVKSAPQESLLPRLACPNVLSVLQASIAPRALLNATNVRRELGAQSKA